MKLNLLFISLAVIASAGPSTGAPAEDFDPDAMSHVGAKQTCIESTAPYTDQRCFYTYIPDCAGQNAPLVFDIHGVNSSPKMLANYSRWLKQADKSCFVVVMPSGNIEPPATKGPEEACFAVPSGLEKPDNRGDAIPCCCNFRGRAVGPEVTDDMTFLRNVAEVAIHDVPIETSNNVTIDRNRIYMGGHSNGCVAAIAMGQIHSDLVAAVACHAGVAQAPFPESYQATPVWIVHGTKDSVVTYDGFTYAVFGAQETHDIIAEKNQCATKQRIPIDNGDYPAMRYISEGCANNVTVELISLINVGHQPYRGKDTGLGFGIVPTMLDTTKLAWQFMSQYSLERPPCRDSFLLMRQGESHRDCAWAGEYSNRCENEKIRSHCPIMCSELDCLVDSKKTFVLQGNGLEKDCEWVKLDPATRCLKTGIRDTCRLTCSSI